MSTHRTNKIAMIAAVLAGALTACGGSSGTSKGPTGPATATLQSISISPATITLPTGGQQTLTVNGSYSDGTTAPVTTGVTWSSSNPSVASMAGTGVITCTSNPLGGGTTTVTAALGDLSAQALVTVTAPALVSIHIEPLTASQPVPLVQPFSAIGHFADGSTAPLVAVTWSSDDGGVATVDDSGYAQCSRKGGVTITATHTASGLSATAHLDVVDPVLRSIVISPDKASIPVGFSRQFTAIGRFSDGDNRPISATWTSSSGSATVGNDGRAQGVTAGTTPVTITASFGGLSATAALTVTGPVAATPIEDVDDGRIDPDVPATYKVGGLTPGAEYLVRLTEKDGNDVADLMVEVVTDASFATPVCSSWAGGPPCRAGVANSQGELFVLVTGPADARFTLRTTPLPVLVANAAARQGTVDTTETYYKVEGVVVDPLTGIGTFQAALGNGASALDPISDAFAYDATPLPIIGTVLPVLGSTAAATSVPKDFVTLAGTPPTLPLNAQPYVTVEGWMTSAGSDFSLSVTSP
jgi:uncharacterized protein YjdB